MLDRTNERSDQPPQPPQRSRAPADFQEHLARLEAAGLLVRIDREVNKDTELHPLVRWQFQGGLDEDERRAFLFTNVVGADGRRYDMPVAVGALSASAQIYAIGMGRPVEDIGTAWNEAIAHPVPPVMVDVAAVPGGGDHRRRSARRRAAGLARLPVPVSTPGFDAAPYLTATLCITSDPDTGVRNMGTYRAALKATDRLGVRMASRIGGAGGYLHWQKYRDRERADAVRDRHWLRAGRGVHRPAETRASTRTRWPSRAALAGAPIRTAKCGDDRSGGAGRCRDRDRRADRLRTAGAGRAVRREPRLRRARRLQHVDAGDRDHAQARAGVRLDHQPGDAERIEHDQEGRLRADVPGASARSTVASRASGAW